MMYKKITAVAMIAATCFSLTMPANASPIAYVDFGDRDNDLNTGTYAGSYWTTIDSVGTTETLTDSATDVALSWTLGVTGIEGDSPNSVGPAGHIFTTSGAATDGLWNRPSNAFYITIAGLDATGAETYDLSLFGNRSNSDLAAVTWEVVGASTVSQTVQQGNVTGVMTPQDFSGVQADGTGTITINMYLPAPGDQDLSIVSAMSIEGIPPPGVPFIASFTASETTVESNDTVTLSWATTNATTVTLDPGFGAVPTSGSTNTTITADTTFTLIASLGATSVTGTVDITVAPVGILSFTASKTLVSSNETITLSWDTISATSASLNPGFGAVPTSGSTNATITADTTFELIASDGAASVTNTLPITIAASSQVLYDGGDLTTNTAWFIREATAAGVDTTPADGLIDAPANNGPIANGGTTGWQLNDQNGDDAYDLPQFQHAFSPSVASEMANGFSLTMKIENLGTASGPWFGYDSASPFGAADERIPIAGVGQIPVDGAIHTVELVWNATFSTFSRSIDGGAATSLTPGGSADNNYTGNDDGSAMFLMDSGSSVGTDARWNIYHAELTLVPAEIATINSFTATPNTFTNGQQVTLSWSVTDADSVSIDKGLGIVSSTGSTNLYPAASTTWTLTATRGISDVTAEATATLSEPFSRMLVDFGVDTEETASPGFFGRYWNNLSVVLGQTPPLETLSTVFNATGSKAEGVTIQVTDAMDRSSSNTAGNEQIYTTDATTDFIYVDNVDNHTGKLLITGLDSSGSTVYDLKFFVTSNRTLPETFITDYTAAGASTNTVSLEAIGNVNTVASIDGMAANASGEIEVTISVNAGTTRYGAISVMEVIARAPSDPATPDPEPVEYDALVPPGAWTIALIPDTQYYTRDNPGVFSAQTVWLRDNIEKYNIRWALHLGDITDDNNVSQWEYGRESMAVLDGYLPYFFVPGNHDYGPGGNASTRDTLMNDYFDYDDYSSRPFFGGAKGADKMDNSYHLISAGGYDWIIVCLEWGPTDSTIAWADAVLTANPGRKAILVTHAYMYYDDTRYDYTGPDQSWNPHGDYSTPDNPNDGQELWDELVKNHDFVLTVNGHVLGDGTGFRTDANLAGQNVHQMLANYQSPIVSYLGGGGWLRLLTINTDGTVDAKSYSPILNQWDTDADQEFTFDFEWYSPADTNSNGVADYYDPELDSDGDGINNYDEFVSLGSGPFETDSDGDGMSDGLESQIGTDPSVNDQSTADAILNNINDFGYHDEQDIVDMNPGALIVTPNGASFDFGLQLETTDDLINTPFTNNGAPVLMSIPVSGGKDIMRVKGH